MGEQSLRRTARWRRRRTRRARFGFGAALRLDSSNADALIGAAECHVERGRMHKQFGPDVLPSVMCEYDAHVSSMRSHFARGWELYARALDLAAEGQPTEGPGVGF